MVTRRGGLGEYSSVARACGWAEARDVESSAEALKQTLEWAQRSEGPILLRVRVGTDQPKSEFFLEDPVVLGRNFQDWLGKRD